MKDCLNPSYFDHSLGFVEAHSFLMFSSQVAAEFPLLSEIKVCEISCAFGYRHKNFYIMSQGLLRNYVYLVVGSRLKEELESCFL